MHKAALALGTANQLTNILRDVGEDALERNRIYMPLEELAAFGISEREVRAQPQEVFVAFSICNMPGGWLFCAVKHGWHVRGSGGAADPRSCGGPGARVCTSCAAVLLRSVALDRHLVSRNCWAPV